MDFLQSLLQSFVSSGKLFLVCSMLFIPLAYLFGVNHKQPYFRRDMVTDAIYWFCGPLIYGPLFSLIVIWLLTHLYHQETIAILIQQGLPVFAAWPLWLQVLFSLLITDFLQYWMHRLFHRRQLWKFHAVHHSSIHLDWLSGVRFHPVNFVIYATLINAIVFVIGFNPVINLILLPFNIFYSLLVHANLNWTYGPLRYFLASPVFHRWHHTSPKEGGNKNFAPNFPFIDILFGTYYDPHERRPCKFGVFNESVPENFLGQIAYPFKRRCKAKENRLLKLEE